jgi:hypothetical protein
LLFRYDQKICWRSDLASSSSDNFYRSARLNDLLPALPPMEHNFNKEEREDLSNGIGDDSGIRLESNTVRDLPSMYLTDDLLHMVKLGSSI